MQQQARKTFSTFSATGGSETESSPTVPQSPARMVDLTAVAYVLVSILGLILLGLITPGCGSPS